MLIKLGVSVEKLSHNIRRALGLVEEAHLRLAGEEAVITSTYEGNHGPGSLHYGNEGIDFRRAKKSFSEIAASLKTSLGANYDVAVEGDHLHVEWDPK